MLPSGGSIRLVTDEAPALARRLLLKLPILTPEAKNKAMQDTAWADGLRGIAALGVVASHLVLCYARALVLPCCIEGTDSPYLFQRPIFRLVSAGYSWVAIFFILMGFVNALKPLKLARSGQADSASNKLALSSFSRILRLVLPATSATIISWTLCQLGAFETARQSDSFWLRSYTPPPSNNIFRAVIDLKDALKRTWMFGFDNIYDQPQWALIYLLQGSLMIIGALLLTVNMAPLWRRASLLGFSFWSLDLSRAMQDPWTGATCFSGVMLAEISLTSLPERLSAVSKLLTPPLAIFSLILMSFTDTYPRKAPWNSALYDFGLKHLPVDNSGGFARTYGSIGGVLLILSIVISPHLRWVLSRRPLQWLGKVSFAIYLLHGMVLRSVFSWILFGGVKKVEFREMHADETWVSDYRYPVPGGLRCACATVVAFAVIFGASQIWNLKVEPLFGKITSRLEKLVSGQSGIEDLLNLHGKIYSEKEALLPIRQD